MKSIQSNSGQELNATQDADYLRTLNSIDEYVKMLLEVIQKIFHKNADVNVQKVGLIYLAKALRWYPELCERYLEVLLVIHDDIMSTILSVEETNIESYIVLSTTSFKYFRTGAPKLWNSAGLATSLNHYVKKHELEVFDLKHIEIIKACFVRPIQKEDKESWLQIYSDLNTYIFISLTLADQCGIA